MSAAVFRQALDWLLSFLKGDGGENSSSRLISIGSATILAFYMLADIVLRFAVAIVCVRDMSTAQAFCYSTGMNENVLMACVGGLCALGGVVYGVNKVQGTKRIAAKRDAQEVP